MNNILNLNVLVSIISNAIRERYTVLSHFDYIDINDPKNEKYINIRIITPMEEIEKPSIVINTNHGDLEIKDISEEEVLRFKLLQKDCERYAQSRCVEDLNNFFVKEAEKENKEVSINDLDNEDE